MTNTNDAIDNSPAQLIVQQLSIDGITLEAFQKATLADDNLTKVAEHVATGWPVKKLVPENLRPYYQIKDELSRERNCLFRNESRFVVPDELQRRLLQLAHEGHPGIVRMKQKLRETYWWPKMDQEIERFVRCCIGCQHSAKSSPKNEVPTTRVEPPKEPWQKVSIDITGPFHTAPQNERFVVVVLDQYSNFPEVLLTGDIKSTRIVQWLSDIFARYGNPESLLSDNGPQFVSEEFTSFLARRNIRHQRAAVYNPQENGQVEVFNRYLKHGAQAFTAAGEKWKEGITSLLQNYRGTPTSSQKTPAELFFKRKMRLSYQIPLPRQNSPNNRQEKATTATGSSQLEEEKGCLSNRGPYKVGSRVMTRRPQVLKGQSPWSGPHTVNDVLGNFTYRLSDGQVWNARKLRRFHQEESTPLVPPFLPIDSDLRRSSRQNKGRPPRRYSPQK